MFALVLSKFCWEDEKFTSNPAERSPTRGAVKLKTPVWVFLIYARGFTPVDSWVLTDMLE